jgi:HK97 family phage prohead protease
MSVLDSPALSREFTGLDLQVRADAAGRTITGIVVPFDRVATVSDGGPAYEESFRRGAFTKSIAERGDRVKLLSHHDRGRNPLGRATLLREDTAGLYGEFAVSRTTSGDEALELVRDGALDSFSVGFAPVKAVKTGKVTVRTEVHLREASLVTFPAYEDARIAAVRSLTPAELEELAGMLRDAIDLRDATPPEPAPQGTPSGAAPAEDPAPSQSARLRVQRNRVLALLKGI